MEKIKLSSEQARQLAILISRDATQFATENQIAYKEFLKAEKAKNSNLQSNRKK